MPQVIKYAILGVPISIKHLDYSWKEILTPRFPVFFSLLPTLVAILLGAIIGPWATEDVYVPQSESILVRIIGLVEAVPYSIIAYVTLFSWMPFVINLLSLGWCALILLFFKLITKKDIQITQAAQRATYFSAFFQSIFFTFYSCLPGLFVDPHSAVTFGSAFVWLVVYCLGMVRVIAVVQSMRLETNGSILGGLLSGLLCVDVWYALSNLILLHI